MTRFIETNDKINHDDPSNITAKNAITENMNKECESNIICRATAFYCTLSLWVAIVWHVILRLPRVTQTQSGFHKED